MGKGCRSVQIRNQNDQAENPTADNIEVRCEISKPPMPGSINIGLEVETILG